MTEREFCFWLRGYICDGDVKALDEKQLKTIRDHLGRVAKPSTEKKKELRWPRSTLGRTTFCGLSYILGQEWH